MRTAGQCFFKVSYPRFLAAKTIRAKKDKNIKIYKKNLSWSANQTSADAIDGTFLESRSNKAMIISAQTRITNQTGNVPIKVALAFV
jgi:hypothetical protein